MKKTLWFIAFILGTGAVYAQRTEFSMQGGSGWFSFFGPNSVNETVLYFLGDSFLANPYGRTSRASYGITGQVQHVTKNTLIYGV